MTFDVAAVDIVAALIKALSLIALLQTMGLALFSLTYRAFVHAANAPLRSLIRRSGTCAIVLTIAYQLLGAARMGGEMTSIFDGALQSMNWRSSSAAATELRLLAMVCVLFSMGRKESRRRIGFALGVAALLISFTISGHLAVHPLHKLLNPLIITHVLIVAFWLGAIRVLMLAIRVESLAQTATIAQQFSKHAIIVVPLIAFAGLAMAFILLPNVAAMFSAYGWLLIAKLLGFCLLMILAAYNKLRLVPAMQRGESQALASFDRVIKVEYALIAIVVLVTAVLTSWYSPE